MSTVEGPDLLIVGAGPTGCIIAEQAASRLGWRCIVVDRRPHVGGLCHDRYHPSGLLIHDYGPHYFRTQSEQLVSYLSSFTEWIPGKYIVKSQVAGRLFPFPINLTTLEMIYGRKLDASSGHELLEHVREDFADPKNAEQWVCSRVGRKLYETFYLGYTIKQWGRHPRELDPTVCGRIPIRLNRDERYVDHRYQIMPKAGFTAMFSNMLKHDLIDTRLETDYRDICEKIRPRFGTVYSGAIDEFFEYKLGALPWHSLEFQFEVFNQEYRQPCVQINYPDNYEYTRSVEIKHVTGQQHDATVIAYEFPSSSGDPYYPVLSSASRKLYAEYKKLAAVQQQRHRIYFAGRLGNFSYINSDEAMENALQLFYTIRADSKQMVG